MCLASTDAVFAKPKRHNPHERNMIFMKSSNAVIKLRQKKLLEHLQTAKNDSVTRIASKLGVSAITVRRDLDLLEKQGYVQRNFGSASYVLPPNVDVQYTTPQGNPSPDKCIIAKKAASLIHDGDIVFFNSSSTVLCILDYIEANNVTIITNNGRALYAHRKRGIDLMLTGGEVYGQKQSLVGEFAFSALAQITATKCFLGVSGISVAGGITSAVIQETAVNRQMLARCIGPKIVVTEGAKIGITRSFFSGNLNEVTHLITDSTANADEIENIKQNGITVLLANEKET